MSSERRFFDVWIVDGNTVYREVPFPVVSDWIQQGRLLEGDRLRRAGTADWFTVGVSPDFSPYLPRSEPDRVDDTAEALERVELDIQWKQHPPDDDDDVDMIPLIDVSLVLLIFFMLTAATGGIAAFVPTPAAVTGNISDQPVQLNINLEGDGEDRRPVFSFSVANKFLDPKQDSNLATMDEMLDRLQEYINQQNERVEVTINAHPEVKSGLVRDLMSRLESGPFRNRIVQKYYGVTEKQ